MDNETQSPETNSEATFVSTSTVQEMDVFNGSFKIEKGTIDNTEVYQLTVKKQGKEDFVKTFPINKYYLLQDALGIELAS